MTATAAQIAQLRRMVAEPATTTYSDVLIQGFIEKYPLLDERGQTPYYFDGSTPPAKVANTSWVATYDLNAAAADVWEEKAAAVSTQVNFSADGGNYSMSNQYEQYMKNARHYRSRRAPTSSRVLKWPHEYSVVSTDMPWIENNPEPRDMDGDDDVYLI
jgi:hypothetical protein